MRVDTPALLLRAASSAPPEPMHAHAVDQGTLLAWLLYAAMGVVLLLLSTAIVLYFQPKNASASALPAVSSASSSVGAVSLSVTSRFVNTACILALYVSLLCLFTAPVDVYLLENALPHVHTNAAALKVLYEVYLGCLAVYSFAGAPLVYHYARQTEIAHITMLFSSGQRLRVAAKRTLCFLLGMSILLVMAMVVLLCGKPQSAEIDWLKPLLKLSSDLAAFFRLLVGLLLLSGMYLWVVVCSRGLASVPLVGLLMEDHSSDRDDAQHTFKDLLRENAMEAQATEQTRETIVRRYAVEQSMSKVDQERLAQIKIRKQLLSDRRAVLETNLKRFTLGGARWRCWRVPVGMVLLMVSLLIIVSMAITSVDKMAHSGFEKGFLLNKATFPNPVDELLVLASRFFPLDYVLFAVLFLYFFLVSFVMLMRHGVRVLCFRMDRVQPRMTSTSTMPLLSLVMIYIAIVGLFSVLTLAPQYATFGHQTFADSSSGLVQPCTLQEAARSQEHPDQLPRHCRMTQLAQFYNTLAVSMPMFGLAFFLGQLLFVFVFAPWLLHSYCMTKPLHGPDDDIDADDPKRQRLLDHY